jgi:hypothetical protein
MSNCRFCGSSTASFGHDFNQKNWSFCDKCYLYQQDLSSLPSPQEEKKRYQEHNNEPEDPSYINYLAHSTELLNPHLRDEWVGLDYGCGPGPGMAIALKGRVKEVHFYDPIFFPELTNNSKTYDFITCIEAAEHFYTPLQEFKKIFSLLKQNGLVLIRTEFYQQQEVLETWWYTKDPTHVCLYSLEFFLQGEKEGLWKILGDNKKNQILLQKINAFPEQ